MSCLPARCGIGKSSFLQVLIQQCIQNKSQDQDEPIGLIIVTDSISRLEGYVSIARQIVTDDEKEMEQFYLRNKKNIAILKSGKDFKEQVIQQSNKPVLLMSTQRYFMLDTKTLQTFHHFYMNGEKYLRSRIIFDEKPYFSQQLELSVKNLNDIDTALKMGLDDTVADKDWIIREFNTFSQRIQDEMIQMEKKRDTQFFLYWSDTRTKTMTSNDELFFQIINDYKDKVIEKYNNACVDLLGFQQLAQDGGIFTCSKKRNGSYDKKFVISVDHKEKFFLSGDIKMFVLDATCNIDPCYELDYVKLIHCEQFSVPLNLTITNCNVTTSKNALCNKSQKSKSYTDAITQYLKRTADDYRNMLVLSYSEIINRFKEDFIFIAHLGNTKGFNDYKDLQEMAHIGLNRFSQLAYFFMYCTSEPKIMEDVKKKTQDQSLQYLDNLFRDSAILNDIMYTSILADFEQNIFRLAIRNMNSKEPVHVWAFYNNEDNGRQFSALSAIMRMRYLHLGVQFEYEEEPPEISVARVKVRKPKSGKDITNPQKIIKWCEEQPIGKIFKISNMLEETGLTQIQYKKIKYKSPVIKAMFESMKTEKRGYYKKAL